MMKCLWAAALVLSTMGANAQSTTARDRWVDSVFRSLSKEQRIAQLMVIRAHSNLGADHVVGVSKLIKSYNVGALCFFQGGPVRQAILTNRYQSEAQTPLMVTIDGEWGLGMRLDSVTRFPYQLTLGALQEDKIVYDMGRAVGEQMKRIGVHVNYAPVVDVNNNPGNPVIGYRSFGEDKYRVAALGVAYTKGMQDAGIMACAKHFPGHGDTEVDSHHDLPVIKKSKANLDSLELYPFRALFAAGVQSVMIAHLAIPSIDPATNRPTSLSKANVTGLMRDQLRFGGLTFTDALEMKGVTKFYPAGAAAVEALMAGNDMLCLPEDVPAAIEAIKKAVKKKRLKQADLDEKTRRVLAAKYDLGLHRPQRVDLANLTADLNAATAGFNKTVAKAAVTVLRNDAGVLPLTPNKRIAYVGIGSASLNSFGKRLVGDMGADTFLFSHKGDRKSRENLVQKLTAGRYDAVIIGIHEYSYRPANNYGIGAEAIALWKDLQTQKTVTFLFGNVYAAANFCSAKTLVALHQDDAPFQQAAADFLHGSLTAMGRLPVSVCSIPYGTGLALSNRAPTSSELAWMQVDSIVQDAIRQRAFPGAVVLAAQGGRLRYHKAFGRYTYDSLARPVTLETVYDLASVTKISATTVAVMKLYESGRIDPKKYVGDYLPWTRGSGKDSLRIEELLLHESGQTPFIPFYKETLDSTRQVHADLYRAKPDSLYNIPVAKNLYLRRDWQDTLHQRILSAPLSSRGRYVYSDNNFILLGKIVEAVTGLPLDLYVRRHLYLPLGMATTTFTPWRSFGPDRIAPTEQEPHFRGQLLQGYVHDEGSSLFGGVAGHAGLFSNAYDLALLYQMLLNGGELNGERILQRETIARFTGYNSPGSRRGWGFDKPDKADTLGAKNRYPSLWASPESFGHTGFTGTCVWVDPAEDLVYIFLSNRVYPTRDNGKLSSLGVRGKVQDAIYNALEVEKPSFAGQVGVRARRFF